MSKIEMKPAAVSGPLFKISKAAASGGRKAAMMPRAVGPELAGRRGVFDLDQTAEKTGWSYAGLRALHEATFAPPINLVQLHTELMKLGFDKPAQREELIDSVSNATPGLMDRDPEEFRRRVMEAAKEALPSPTLSPTPAEPQREYSPELAMWIRVRVSESQYQIRAASESFGQPGALIATIDVNPAFNKTNCENIARLIEHAPYLWRNLREVAPRALTDAGANDEFFRATDCLWQAAGRFPFVWPHIDKEEEKPDQKRHRLCYPADRASRRCLDPHTTTPADRLTLAGRIESTTERTI